MVIEAPLLSSKRVDREPVDQILQIIVVDDRDGFEMLSRLLNNFGQFSLHWAVDGDRLMEMLEQGGFDCVIVESVADGESGFTINEMIRTHYPVVPPVIIVTKVGSEQRAVQAFRCGFSDYLNKNGISGHSLKAAILRAVDAKRLEQNRLDQIAQLSALAMHDLITGLSNRSYLDNRLTLMLDNAKRHHRPFALLLIDINHFRLINDNYGRAIGDLVLRRFSEKLKQAARRSDMFGRFGADEFLCLIDGDVSPKTINLAGKRLADALCFTAEFENIGIRLSASIGASIYPDNGTDIEALVKAAATAAFEAKTSDAGFRLSSIRPTFQQEESANGVAGPNTPLQSNGTRISAPANVTPIAVSSGVAPQLDTTRAPYEAAAESNPAEFLDGPGFCKIESRTAVPGPNLVNREDNRRLDPRHRVFKRGRIVTKNGMSTLDCTIRDISERGARIAMAATLELPEQFYFQIIGGKSKILAEKRWKNGMQIGLKFLTEEKAK